MRLETSAGRINGAGGEVIAISVDGDERQAGMSRRWGLRSIQLVGDPGGERYLRRLDLYDPDERDGLGLPAVLVIDPGGEVAYRYQGRDFADRTTDDQVHAALDALGLPAVAPEPQRFDVDVPDDLRGFFRPSDFALYHRGNRMAAVAIARRLPSKETAAVAREHRKMSEASLAAWDEHRSTVEGPT